MQIIKKNKRANFDFFILEKFIAGIVLKGAEVKEIKSGHIVLDEAYVRLRDKQLFLWNAVISTSHFPDIDQAREKKLLVHKKEILVIERFLAQKGLTAIPLALGIEHGLIKVEIGIAKGKRRFDKRETIKKRETERMLRDFRNR